jgi:hypothetical protein
MAATVGQGQKIRTREGEELWDSTVPGTIWLIVADDKGRDKDVVVRGFGRLRISPDDREICQEMVVDPQHDVFTNGSLVRVDADQNENPKTASPDALNTDALLEIFALSGSKFTEKVDSLNELTVRRLREVAEDVDATNSQIVHLDSVIAEKWAVGGDTPSYRELKGLGQVASQTG